MTNDSNDIISDQIKNPANINESVHVITDQKFDELVDIIIKYFKYELYKQAVEQKIIIVDKEYTSTTAADIEMCGKTFDEYMRDRKNNETKNLSLPIRCVFMLKDDDNPCKNWIASDCTYEFIVNRSFLSNGYTDIKNAFVTKRDGNLCLHGVEFSFNCTLYNIDGVKSNIRHELKHAYIEFMYHRGLYNNLSDDVKKTIADVSLGVFKDKDENIKDIDYQDIVKAMSMDVRCNDFETAAHIKSQKFIAKYLYYLTDKEIAANYSSYYQDCKSSDKLSFEMGAYLIYLNLFKDVSRGVLVHKDDGKTQSTVVINPFDDKLVIDKWKRHIKHIFRKTPKDGKELENMFKNRILHVMNRMEKIYDYIHDDVKSAYENYNAAIDVYYKRLKKRCQDLYGDEDGVIIFTQEKIYQIPIYESVIREIEKQILSD